MAPTYVISTPWFLSLAAGRITDVSTYRRELESSAPLATPNGKAGSVALFEVGTTYGKQKPPAGVVPRTRNAMNFGFRHKRARQRDEVEEALAVEEAPAAAGAAAGVGTAAAAAEALYSRRSRSSTWLARGHGIASIAGHKETPQSDI